jgi:hypothetical protein
LLSALECQAQPSSDRRGHRLVVEHGPQMTRDVHRLVEIIDPRASQARLVDARRALFQPPDRTTASQ